MNGQRVLPRRQLLKTMAATGALAAADLAWWEEPLIRPRRAWGAAPVRFQFSVPEPKRNVLVESLVQRFNQAQKDFEVKLEFVPQAQARQKLITSIAAGNPPDCCQVWDNWVGEFEGMGAVEDLTAKAKEELAGQNAKWLESEQPDHPRSCKSNRGIPGRKHHALDQTLRRHSTYEFSAWAWLPVSDRAYVR